MSQSNLKSLTNSQVQSMTAFARAESSGDWGQVSLEMRSLNQRFLEINPRMPEEFRALESIFRERLQQKLSRGKVDFQFRYKPASELGEAALQLNDKLINSLLPALEKLKQAMPDAEPISLGQLMTYPGLLQSEQTAQEVLHDHAKTLFDEALVQLIKARRAEGEKLADMINSRLLEMAEIAKGMRTILPEIRQQVRARLEQKLNEISTELEPGRIEQEFVIQAQKLDVDEELDRLEMHIDEVSRLLAHSKPIGRKLDFLAQELNREANTLGSKSNDPRTTAAAVDLKVLIEQIREQVQNIE